MESVKKIILCPYCKLIVKAIIPIQIYNEYTSVPITCENCDNKFRCRTDLHINQYNKDKYYDQTVSSEERKHKTRCCTIM